MNKTTKKYKEGHVNRNNDDTTYEEVYKPKLYKQRVLNPKTEAYEYKEKIVNHKLEWENTTQMIQDIVFNTEGKIKL